LDIVIHINNVIDDIHALMFAEDGVKVTDTCSTDNAESTIVTTVYTLV